MEGEVADRATAELHLSRLCALVAFKVHDPDHPRADERLGRTYTLVIQIDQTVQFYAMVVYRGGPSRSPATYSEIFPDHDSLLADVKSKISRRIQHGYRVLGWDNDFPLLAWMRERGYLTNPDPNFVRPAVQLLLQL